MKKSEFSFIGDIATLFGTLPHHGFEAIGDDCTVLDMGDDALVMTTDMLVEDVHFLRGASSAEEVGRKSLMVNLSDVAAMGATPIATLLSLSLPESAQGEWSEAFMRGYYEACKESGVALVGGDTTASRDRITINIVAIGKAPKSNIKRRSAAKVGDVIMVTGKLGASAAGLRDVIDGRLTTRNAKIHLMPEARVKEGIWLGAQREVHAMMDISDGIASDLHHILRASGVGAWVELRSLPLSPQLHTICEREGWSATELATSAGEDYELLLTAPEEIAQEVDFPLYPIGKITEGESEIEWYDGGKKVTLKTKGFTHF